MDSRLAFALNTVYNAGRFSLGYFQNGTEVLVKSDDTPVTAADKGAERLIREAIEKQFPGEAILGEEEGLSGHGKTRWVVDPIDGTKSFVSGVPLFACLLSYEIDEEPVLGVCYLPALEEMIYASKDGGAFCNGRPIHVSSQSEIKMSSLSCGGHITMMKRGRMDGFLELSKHAMLTRTWGDAYGHVLVATGRVDAMVDPSVHRWDISAMALIVREAGGRVTDFKGRDVISDEAVSSNGAIHEAILAAF
jgi:histidinol-phosphatase